MLFVSPSKIAHDKFYIYCPPLLLNEIYAHARTSKCYILLFISLNGETYKSSHLFAKITIQFYIWNQSEIWQMHQTSQCSSCSDVLMLFRRRENYPRDCYTF